MSSFTASRSMRAFARLGRRAAVVTIISAAAFAGIAGSASAHVTAQPGNAVQGSYAKVAFRTPNEEDSAATIKLEVSFPTDHPIASVSIEPVPGWAVAVDKTNLATPIKTDDGELSQAVSKITWSGGQLTPGQFQDFSVSLGPLPTDTDTLVFKAVQTYSNGDVVRWIEATPPGGPEPEHPAPTLTLTEAAGADAAGHGAHGDDTSMASMPGPGRSNGAAITLGIIGAVLGLIGVILGGLGLRRGSRTRL
jgi:uncharacterized protein YcnI